MNNTGNQWGRGDEAGQANKGAAPPQNPMSGDISQPPPASLRSGGSGGREHRFQFNGSGKEFFGIWIVNVLLSIITLGIYSAWAKVRTKRYFNGNTVLDKHAFGYHADPIAILKGRILVVVVLIAINLISQIHPALAIVVFVFYAIALPWVIVRGLRFNANMTSYRNVRFHFEARKLQAFMAFIIWPLLAMLTLGILIPFASRASARFLGNGHFYGGSRFSADPALKPYYKALGIVLLLILAPIAAGLVLLALGAIVPNSANLGLLQVLGVITYIFLISSAIIYAAYSRNIGFNALRLEGGHRFTSTVTPGRYTWIALSNAFLSIITIGLYIPWAKVRITRYLAANTTMIAVSDLDNFAAGQVDKRGVASGEFLDIEGIDFGF